MVEEKTFDALNQGGQRNEKQKEKREGVRKVESRGMGKG